MCTTWDDVVSQTIYRSCDLDLDLIYNKATPLCKLLVFGQRHAKRDLRTYAKSVDQDQPPRGDAASGQGLHFLTLVTSVPHIFLAV